MVLSIISLRSAGLLNSAPASRGECVGPPLGAAVLAAVDTEDVAWFETTLVIDPIPDGAPAWSTAGFRECHDIRYEIGWEPGRRELKSARLWFDDPDDGEVLIEIEKVFTFRMRGIGYWHPQWVTEASTAARDGTRVDQAGGLRSHRLRLNPPPKPGDRNDG